MRTLQLVDLTLTGLWREGGKRKHAIIGRGDGGEGLVRDYGAESPVCSLQLVDLTLAGLLLGNGERGVGEQMINGAGVSGRPRARLSPHTLSQTLLAHMLPSPHTRLDCRLGLHQLGPQVRTVPFRTFRCRLRLSLPHPRLCRLHPGGLRGALQPLPLAQVQAGGAISLGETLCGGR